MQFFFAGLALILFAPIALADQITMKDGDRVTGDIVKKDGDTLTVKSKNFGTVTLKWDDVATVKTDEPINVALPGGKTVKANIETQNGQIQIGPQTVAPQDVVTLRNDSEERTYQRYLHPGLLDLWAITGNLNIAGTKGNAETSTLTTPFAFVRASNTSRTTAYFNAIRSTATIGGVNAQTANAIRGGWGYNRKFDSSKMFVNAFNDYEYDKFQLLDLRVVIGGGAGYNVWTHENNRLSTVGGVAWDHESFGASTSSPAFTRDSAEIFVGDDFYYKLSTRTTVTQAFRAFDNLSGLDEYRLNFDVTATTQLKKWLNWNIALSDRFLSNPVPGREKNDFLYSTGFGFIWSRQ